ncbi:MAG: Ger(x)C family spore germination protein [Oscillospiraceae bacterium]|nr:Ger(x)C family spore germination protein [Oscillospiraceae bacterium]
MKNKLLALILCLICLGGCWDKQELEDHTFVIILGVDKADDRDLFITIAFPITQTNSGGAESQDEYSVMSAKAPTIAEAISLLNVSLAGPVSLFSTKTLVISEELARDDLLSHLFSTWRYEQMRNNTNVIVASSIASDFVSARVENTLIDPLRQEDLLLEGAAHSAHSKPIQLLDLTGVIQTDSRDAAAMYGGLISENPNSDSESQENFDNTEAPVRSGYLPGQAPLSGHVNTQISGLAVFRGNRMVGVLDSLEAQTLSMMTRSNTRKLVTLPDPLSPEDRIVFSILPTGKSRARGSLTDDHPIFDVNVKLRANIEHIRGDADYDKDFLAEYIRQATEKEMETLTAKLQHELNADLLGLGDRLARNFLTVQEWEAYGWREKYRDAVINIHLDLALARSGI